MTQDQPGQAQGAGYIVRGEVVPDDETDAVQAEQSGPMTRLRKVASALRGDQPDQTVPDQAVPDQAASTSPDTPDPNGSWPGRPGEPGAMSTPAPEDEMGEGEYADATRPDDVGAVRSPDAADRHYWDDETAPEGGATASDPSVTAASTHGTTAPVSTGGTAPAPGYGSRADTVGGYDSQAGTEAVPSSYPGTTQGYGSQAGTSPGYGTEAGTASRYGSRAGTVPDPQGSTSAGPGATAGGTTASGTPEVGPAGRHAAAAEEAGLRPGEATDRLGDFGDIAFGNLLPDAAQYTAQWQQIQFRFVDDPEGSVTEAADVVSQVTAKLEAAIQERQRAIQERQLAIQERASALRGRWGEGSNADTETLRETLRMYRTFMDQLIGPAS
jgi:hypothetical protein